MLPVTRAIGHKEWTGRKSDPVHSMAWRRNRVANFRPRTQEDDMPNPSDLWSYVRKTGEPHPYDRIAGTDWKTGVILELLRTQAASLAALTALVAEQNGLTLDDVRRVVAEEVARGIDVDVTVSGGDQSPTA
jgi:hypothetical protein